MLYLLDGELTIDGFGLVDGLNVVHFNNDGEGISATAKRYVCCYWAGNLFREKLAKHGPFCYEQRNRIVEAMRDYQTKNGHIDWKNIEHSKHILVKNFYGTMLKQKSASRASVSDLIKTEEARACSNPERLNLKKFIHSFRSHPLRPAAPMSNPGFISMPRMNNLNSGQTDWATEWRQQGLGERCPVAYFKFGSKNFTRNGVLHAHAMYDLGGANAMLSLQAVELGLQVRQMAGFQWNAAASPQYSRWIWLVCVHGSGLSGQSRCPEQ